MKKNNLRRKRRRISKGDGYAINWMIIEAISGKRQRLVKGRLNKLRKLFNE